MLQYRESDCGQPVRECIRARRAYIRCRSRNNLDPALESQQGIYTEKSLCSSLLAWQSVKAIRRYQQILISFRGDIPVGRIIVILLQVIEVGVLGQTLGHPDGEGNPIQAGLPPRHRSGMCERSCGVSYMWRGFSLGFSGQCRAIPVSPTVPCVHSAHQYYAQMVCVKAFPSDKKI